MRSNVCTHMLSFLSWGHPTYCLGQVSGFIVSQSVCLRPLLKENPRTLPPLSGCLAVNQRKLGSLLHVRQPKQQVLSFCLHSRNKRSPLTGPQCWRWRSGYARLSPLARLSPPAARLLLTFSNFVVPANGKSSS